MRLFALRILCYRPISAQRTTIFRRFALLLRPDVWPGPLFEDVPPVTATSLHKCLCVRRMRREGNPAKIIRIHLTVDHLLVILTIPPEAGLYYFGVRSTYIWDCKLVLNFVPTCSSELSPQTLWRSRPEFKSDARLSFFVV